MARPAGEIRVGCGMQQETPQVEPPWKSHAESKGLVGESETLSCLWALNLAQPPLPLHFPACCSSGAAEGAARSAVPARAQSSSPSCPGQPLPSRACGCSLLAPRFVVPKRANTAGRGGSPGGNESSPGPAAGKSLRGCFCRVRCWGFSLGSHNALRSRMP